MSIVTANNNIAATFQQALVYGTGQTQKVPVPMILRSVFNVSGTLADQCTKLYNPTNGLTFLASTPQTIDLQSLVDIFGAALSFSTIRFFAIRNNATTDGWVLTLGAAGANEWDGIVSNAGTIPVYPSTALNDGFKIHQMPNTTGAAVDGTHHLLKLDPGAHAFTADLWIAGN